MNTRISLALITIILSSTVTAQQLQIQPGWPGFRVAGVKLPHDADLAFEPSVEVRQDEILSKDQPDLVGMDPWSGVDRKSNEIVIPDLLVVFYDAPWDASMKQRVRAANVVDESAIFPIPSDHYFSVSIAATKPQPAVFAPAAIIPESNRYAKIPIGREPFVIIDLSQSEHLGMAPSYRGAFQP